MEFSTFNTHYNLPDHAFLSPSQNAWLNYDGDKLLEAYIRNQAKAKGTRLHEWACETIQLGIKMPRNNKTLNMYVNDAIGFGMTPEQRLYYSENCHGTADAISFKKNKLRIHDYKSGITPAKPVQLFIYAALFCLEYGYDPRDIEIECRIYQNDERKIYIPEVTTILNIIQAIIVNDDKLKKIKMEVN